MAVLGLFVLAAGIYYFWRYMTKDDVAWVTPWGLAMLIGFGITGIVASVVVWRRNRNQNLDH